MRAVTEAVLAHAATPEGFTTPEVAAKVRPLLGPARAAYTARQAGYDLANLRGKDLVERVGTTRRYRAAVPDVRTLAALLIPNGRIRSTCTT